jgi:predicted deacylase
VKCIHPDFIWHVDLREEQKYDNMIGGYLMGKGTMYLPLETKELAWNGSEEITREANAIKRVLARLGVIEGDSSAGFSPMYKRFPITADDAGLFLPKKKIMTVVQEGDVIAEIVDLSTLTTSEVRVKRSGMLIQIRRKDIVTTGQDIYAIGVDSRNQ